MFSTLFDPERLIILPTISSTNEYLWDLVRQNPPEGTVVQAYVQTQGRGQKGNSWSSREGENLLLSALLYPKWIAAYRLFDLSMMVSVALVATLRTFLVNEVIRIKWPNDILVDGRKISGILIENQLEGHKVKASVLGIGLNVNQITFDKEIAHRAVSIRFFTNEIIPINKVREKLLHQIEREYNSLQYKGRIDLKRIYLSHLWGYRQFCKLEWRGKTVSAFIEGVNDNGQLMAVIENDTHAFDIKEVTWLNV